MDALKLCAGLVLVVALMVLAVVAQELGWLTLVLVLGYLICLLPLVPHLLHGRWR